MINQISDSYGGSRLKTARQPDLRKTARDVRAVAQGIRELVQRADLAGPAAESAHRGILEYDRNGERLMNQVGGNLDITQTKQDRNESAND